MSILTISARPEVLLWRANCKHCLICQEIQNKPTLGGEIRFFFGAGSITYMAPLCFQSGTLSLDLRPLNLAEVHPLVSRGQAGYGTCQRLPRTSVRVPTLESCKQVPAISGHPGAAMGRRKRCAVLSHQTRGITSFWLENLGSFCQIKKFA